MYSIYYQSGLLYIVCLMGRPIKEGIITIEQAKLYIKYQQVKDFALFKGLPDNIKHRVLDMGHC